MLIGSGIVPPLSVAERCVAAGASPTTRPRSFSAIVSSVTLEAATPVCEAALIGGGIHYGYQLGKNGSPNESP